MSKVKALKKGKAVSKETLRLREENSRLLKELNEADAAAAAESNSLMEALTPKNLICYLLTIFLPPVGIAFIWLKHNTITMPAKAMWTGVGCMIIYEQILMLLQMFS